MADGQALPPFRPLPQKEPDIEMVRKPDGTIYLTPRQAPGDRPKTIPHCLDERASEHPDRVWLKQRDPQTDEWRALTYGEGKKKVDSLAQALLDMGAGPDAPVMILSGNSIESALVILAAQKIGAPAAPISVPYSTMSSDFGKLKHCFGAVKPKAIFVQQVEPFKPALDALGDHGCTVFAKEGATNEIRSFDELAATEPTAAVSEAMSKLNEKLTKAIGEKAIVEQRKGRE